MDDNKVLHKNTEVILDIMNEVKKHVGEILRKNIEIKNNTIQKDIVKQL